MVIGKLIGKAVGHVVALPVTVASEIVEAAEVAVDTAAKAIDNGVTKATEPRR